MNCTSKNLLRVITCQGCHENFVGQIGNEVKKHITVHRQQSKDPSTRKIPLSEHLPISNCAKTKSNIFLYSHSINSQKMQQNKTDP